MDADVHRAVSQPVNLPTSASRKRRSAVACLRCRKRKVRCGGTENGGSCTNCHLDDGECVIVESRRRQHGSRGKGARPSTEQELHSTPSNMTLEARQSQALTPPLFEGACVGSLEGDLVPFVSGMSIGFDSSPDKDSLSTRWPGWNSTTMVDVC